jgi:hypothetical protein
VKSLHIRHTHLGLNLILTAMDKDLEDERLLQYTVVGSSGHSGTYVAENILVDSPNDQVSALHDVM